MGATLSENLPRSPEHLIRCDRFGGSCHIRTMPPDVIECDEAVYIPFDESGNWGLFDNDGCAITGAANLRGPGRHPIQQTLKIDLPEKQTLSDNRQMIYIGQIFNHFGHFITTTLSRFWYVRMAPEAKLLCHSRLTPVQMFQLKHMRVIFGALGLTPDRFVQFEEPTRIRRLIVPGPSFEENHFAHVAYSECVRAIGEKLLRRESGLSRQPVYLSKARLARGVHGLVNEAQVEAALTGLGVSIVHPEELPVPAQLQILDSHATILGTLGSAMHFTAFLKSGRRIVGLNHIDRVNSNFLLLDKLSGNEATYVYSPKIEPASDPRFKHAFRLANPEETARELVALI